MTVREFYPPGYDPTLDRRPPRRFNCRALLIWGGLFLLIACGLLSFILMRVAAQGATTKTPTDAPEATATAPQTALPTVDAWSATGTAIAIASPTFTPSQTPTLDDWSLTGTALFLVTATATSTPSQTPTLTPTMDYCWFLTPSPTPSPTAIVVTPDSWSATGTAVFRASTTPTLIMPSTQPPPRAWCDLTPESILNAEQTPNTDWPTPMASFTWLPSPTVQPTERPPQQPMVIHETVEVFVTTEPIYITSEPVQLPPIVVTSPPVQVIIPVIITATPQPTLTPSPTMTATATYTATFTATATHTETPTNTATHTSTHTPTFTWTPTPTETPTATLEGSS